MPSEPDQIMVTIWHSIALEAVCNGIGCCTILVKVICYFLLYHSQYLSADYSPVHVPMHETWSRHGTAQRLHQDQHWLENFSSLYWGCVQIHSLRTFIFLKSETKCPAIVVYQLALTVMNEARVCCGSRALVASNRLEWHEWPSDVDSAVIF